MILFEDYQTGTFKDFNLDVFPLNIRVVIENVTMFLSEKFILFMHCTAGLMAKSG